MRAFLALALAAAATLAGCAAPADPAAAGDPPASVDAWEAARGALAGLPCEAASVTDETSENVRTIATLEGGFAEMDLRGHVLLAANGPGFEVIDASDPLAPRSVSTFEGEGMSARDVKWLPDGRGAIVGTQEGLALVDLSDLAAPTLAASWKWEENGLPRTQSHMVATGVIDGNEYVFVATQARGQPVYVLALDGWEISYLSKFELPVAGSTPLGFHDVMLYEDPLLDGKPLLYVASGEAGFDVLDVSDPAKPARIGGLPPSDPFAGYTHTVRVEVIDGKRIVATMMEVGVNTLKVYDATDLDAPVLLATWRAHAERATDPQHNIQLHHGRLYMAHYAHGVYAFNVTGLLAGPPLVGDLEPVAHWAVENPGDGGPLGFANVFDVLVHDGVLQVSDMSNGLATVGYGCLAPGNVAERAAY